MHTRLVILIISKTHQKGQIVYLKSSSHKKVEGWQDDDDQKGRIRKKVKIVKAEINIKTIRAGNAKKCQKNEGIEKS
jgi:hypothetical protein